MLPHYSAKSLVDKVLVILTICTIWSPDNLSQIKTKLFKFYVVILRSFVMVPYVLSQIINVCMVFHDLEKFAEASYVLLTIILETVKISIIFLKQQDIKQLLLDLDDDSLNPRTQQESKIFCDSYKKNKFLFWMVLCMYNSTTLFWGLFPLFDDKSGSLPIPAWYPFPVNDTPIFQIVYFQQCSSTSLFATLGSALDLIVLFFIILLSLRVDILLHRLRCGVQEYLKICRRGISLEEKKMDFLKECAMEHELIIQYTKRVTNISKHIVVSQFSVSCVILCITMFHASVENTFSMKSLSTFMYQACVIIQIFLYSWYGNELSLKSSQIAEAAYFSDWYHQGTKYCRTLKFIMMRAQNPIKVTGGYFFTLSLDLFTTILRSSWSYFALLHQVHSAD